MDKRNIPRLLIAAAASGSGKTLINCALLEALKERGRVPAACKCGPDYIDPMFHERIIGVKSVNLDSYFMTAESIRQTLAESEGGCVCIEGVMGIYDGRSPSGKEGSCYEIAAITDTPILLVVDARGSGRTLLSVIRGILEDDEAHLIRGILLNRMSAAFYERFRPCLEEMLAKSDFTTEIIGCFPAVPGLHLDSRHLGLKLPDEVADLKKQIRHAAGQLETCCDLDRLESIMRAALPLERSAPDTHTLDRSGKPGPVLAVAWDEAFCFYYRDNLRMFESMGIRIVPFSPLRDRTLPKGTCGILLGGGYPELHARELAENESMRTAIRDAIEAGMPSLAECGGFLYLHESIEDTEGNRYPMVGLVKGSAYSAGHPVRFGYLEIASSDENCFAELKGLRGHEFHYYESTKPGRSCVAEKKATGERWECLIGNARGLWGFPHFYYGSKPAIVRRFAAMMREY